MTIRSSRTELEPSSWVYCCFKSFLTSNRKARRKAQKTKPSTRLVLTTLEDRLTPTTLHWLGTTSSLWSVTTNWQEGQAPVSGDRLIFDTALPGFAATANAFAPSNDIAALTNLAIGINDSSSAGNFAIVGNDIGLVTTATAITSTVAVGTVAAPTTFVASIGNNLALGANTTVNVGLGSLTLGGVVSGGFSLTDAGSSASTLTLNGANTYTGGTVLNSGTVAVGTNTALGTGGINFNGGALSSATAFLTLANGFTVNAPSTLTGGSFFTISGDGVLNTTLTLGSVTLNGAISGAGGLDEIGFPGGTTLGGTTANTFTGGTKITFGGITLNKTPGVNALASPVTLASSFSSLTLNASNQLNNNVPIIFGAGFASSFNTNGFSDSVPSLTGVGSLNTGGSVAAGLTVTGAGSQLFTGAVSGSGLLTYNGTGSLTLAGASSSYTGTLTAAGGALVVAADFSGATAKATGGTLDGTGVVKSITATSGFVDPGTAGSGGTLNTAATATATSLTGATFRVDLAPHGPSDQLVLGAGATLDLTGATLLPNALGATFATNYTLISSPTGGISNTFTGLVDGATVTVGGQAFIIHYTANAVTLTKVVAGGTPTLHWTGTTSSSWNVATNWVEGVIPVSGDTLVFDTSTPGFAATAAAFAPSNNISGLTNMAIVINDASTAGNFAIVGNSVGLVTTAGIGISSTVAVGTTAAPSTFVASIGDNLALGANTTVNVGLGTLTLSGAVSGGFSLTEGGSAGGTLTLSSANTYSGGTVLSSGTVSVGTDTSLGSGQLTFTGGTLANVNAFLHVANPFVVSSASTIGGGSFFDLDGNGTLNANLRLTNTGFLTLAGAISGAGGLIEDGVPGSTKLAGTVANSYTGPTVVASGGITLAKTPGVKAIVSPIFVAGGSLNWNASNQLTGTSVTLGVGGSLNTNGSSDSITSIAGIGTVNTGGTAGKGLTVTGNSVMLVTGPVTGSGQLNYTGTGSLTLGGTSTGYTGQLTAAGGSLLVNADFSGATAVSQGTGTLGGTGIVKSLPGTGSGKLSPGGSGVGGILTTASTGSPASVLSGQTFQADIANNALSDELVVGASATINLTNSTLSVNVLSSSAGNVYTLIASPTGGITGMFSGLPDGSSLTAAGRHFQINYTANAVTLSDLEAILLTPSTLPPAQVGVAYNQTITPSGGTGAITLAVSAVTNTTGLVISSGPGPITITGTPTSAGTVTFTVTPTDSLGAQAGTVYTISVTVLDTTPPTLLSIDDGDADNAVSPGTLMTYTVTFSEDIDSTTVTAADFNNAGTSAITIGTITETSPGVFAVQVTPTTVGTLILRIPTGAVIKDVAGNNLVVPVQDNDTVNVAVDITPPTLVSIDDGDADDSVVVNTLMTYTVTFSEDMDSTTVTAADFDNAGTSTITIGTITETSPGVFAVQVTPTTVGTVILRIPTGAVVNDVAGNSLVVPVQDNDTINVTPDTTPPALVSIDDGDADNLVGTNTLMTYTVTFSEDIDSTTVTAADFDNAGTSAITIGTITETSPGVFTVQVTPTTAGTVILRIPTGAVIKDVAGNNLVVPVQDNDTVNVSSDLIPPTLVSIDDGDADNAVTPGTLMTYTVTFSEDIDSTTVTAADFNNAGTSAITIGTITETSPGVFTVQVTPTTAGTVILRIPTGAVVNDVSGNSLVVPVQDNDTVNVTPDTTAPTVTISAPSASTSTGGSITYTVTYADANFATSTLTAADVTLNKTGTATGTVAVSGTGTTRTVTISGITGNGTLGITLAAGTASDTAGNLAPAAGPSVTFVVHAQPIFAVGGSNGVVRILDAATGTAISSFRPLDFSIDGTPYTGLVEVALGDLNGDGVADLFVAAANPVGVDGLDPSKAAKVFVFDGESLAEGLTPAAFHTFTPFGTTAGPGGLIGAYTNGLNIAVGDVNGDGTVEMIAGTRGGTATEGKAEYGRLVVVSAGAAANGHNDTIVGSILTPFGATYQKGVVVAAGNLDGTGGDEIAVTRGGPVAASNPNKSIKLKAYKFNGSGLTELDLNGGTDGAFAPFPSVVRDGRVAFVDPDGDGKEELVFSALDRSDPSNTQVRIAAFDIDTITGFATAVSTGSGVNGSYVVGTNVQDHAITHVAVTGTAGSNLALLANQSTGGGTSGIFFLSPTTGALLPGGFSLNVVSGGVAIDGI